MAAGGERMHASTVHNALGPGYSCGRLTMEDVQAEKEYCRQVLADTEALQGALYAELRGRIQEADQSAPLRRGCVPVTL